MNDEEMLLLLLQTIRVNGNTMMLLNHGYTLIALSQSIDQLKEAGLAKSKNGDLTLTKKGEALFYAKNAELGRKGFYKYMGRMLTMKEEPMPLDQVYVPLKRGKGQKK